MPSHQHFTPAFFKFLRQLGKNNTREWFQANKDTYDEHVKNPMLRFIADVKPRMAKISPRIDVDPKPVGGSLGRLNRDTRFSKDKSPYKTSIVAMFGHDKAGELLLGYRLSLAPGEIKAYTGLCDPDGPTLEKIRTRIMVKPGEWRKAVGEPDAGFLSRYTFEGESLKRPPKIGTCAPEEGHPLIEDLKRKSHAANVKFDEKAACSPDFIDAYMESVKLGPPLMAFLCKSVDVAY